VVLTHHAAGEVVATQAAGTVGGKGAQK